MVNHCMVFKLRLFIFCDQISKNVYFCDNHKLPTCTCCISHLVVKHHQIKVFIIHSVHIPFDSIFEKHYFMHIWLLFVIFTYGISYCFVMFYTLMVNILENVYSRTVTVFLFLVSRFVYSSCTRSNYTVTI